MSKYRNYRFQRLKERNNNNYLKVVNIQKEYHLVHQYTIIIYYY